MVATHILYIKVCLQVSWSATAYVEKSSKKPFVAPEEAVCNLVNCLNDVAQRLRGIVGYADRFLKIWSLVLHRWTSYGACQNK